jgi:predicted negative regulator of RcsB-dependent stress response
VRYTRQELKQDKFAESAAEAAHWTIAHRKTIINGVIALAVVLAVGIGIFWYRDHRQAAAAQKLGDALVTYNAPALAGAPAQGSQMVSFTSSAERALAARKQFYAISSEYGSSRAGQWAHYFAALCEVDLGNYAVAEGQLKDVVQSRDAELASLANLVLASVYRNQKKDADAIAIYKDLIDHPTLSVPKTTAQLGLADLYQATQPAEANKLYEQITKDDAKGPAAQIAAQHQKTTAP